MTPCGTIMAVNWRTKLITELDRDGRVVKQFTSPEMQQPTRIAVNSKSDVIIADNTAGCLFIFDNAGRLVITTLMTMFYSDMHWRIQYTFFILLDLC